MSTNEPQNKDNQEIDLFMLFTKVGDFFQWINRMLFLAVHFFVKNGIVVIVLLLFGFGVGLFLDKNNNNYDQQIIVAPNFKSTDYLYAKIDLLATKIAEKDSAFFKSLGIVDHQDLLRIKIEPVVDIYKLISSNEQNFELLALLAQSGDLKNVLKETTTSKNYNFHTIILSTDGKTSQKQLIDPLLAYLNTTPYYKDIQKIAIGNIQEKIKVKEDIILQIDEIIKSYGSNKEIVSRNDKMIYYNDNNQLDNIIKTKDTLASTMAALKIELFNSKKIINDSSIVLNVKNDKFTNGKFKFLIPLLFIGLFIVLRLFLSFYKSQSAKYA